ncbi:MAG: aldolase [Pirellulales bacterium]|nr:aldolase [Pirellulales bacterium]
MRPSQIKAKLRRGEPVLITTLHLTDPSVFELASLMGFDGIWMDMEHHFYSLETASCMMRATRLGVTDILARPGKGEFMRMQRMLEAGAQGIMYPRCDDAEEAAEVVQWVKFPPKGKRGFDGGNPDMPYCSMPMTDYIEWANRETFVFIQVEHPHTLDHVDQIARLDGVDALILGPADFSIHSGVPGQFDHPKVQRAIDRIAAAAKKGGKAWGVPCGNTDQAKQMFERGARVLFYNADILMVKQGLEQMQQDFAPLGFTFENRLKPDA